ncbi:MAG: dynamin family protein [Acidimicrobiales bacterium]
MTQQPPPAQPAQGTSTGAGAPGGTTRRPDLNADVRGALELGLQACTAYDRPDLGERVQRRLDQVGDPNVQVVVVGEFKQGKSSLINALLNARICPVDDDIATAVPTILRFGEEKGAEVIVASPADPDGPTEKRPIPFDQVPNYATELGVSSSDAVVKGVEIELPRKLLSTGLVLVDTPGVGGLGSAHATAALGAMSVADAAVFVSDASQEFTRAEVDFLRQAIDLCQTVICVMTKTDFYPAWRKVLDLNKGHLERLGIDVPILPVSSMLRAEAVRRNDRELNVESGFPVLVSALSDDIVARHADLVRARARQDLLGVSDQLASQFEAELAALTDPERAKALVDQLEEAKRRSEQLKSRAAKWSTTLNDGIADLSSDVDFDFRQRIRKITQEADEAIDDSDPLDTWSEFEPWLTSRVSHEVVSNYRFLTDRAAQLSATVGDHFALDGSELLEHLDVQSPEAALQRVTVDPGMEMDEQGIGAKGFTVLRGSYTGILMFTMLGSMVGVALGPVAVGIGLVMGRKTLKDEKSRQVAMRRSQAKNSVRRYCDDVSFQVSKDCKDTLRQVQRQLRDHYSRRAEELHRSTTEALKAATEAAKVGAVERATRTKDIEAELARIGGLRKRAAALSEPTAAGGAA